MYVFIVTVCMLHATGYWILNESSFICRQRICTILMNLTNVRERFYQNIFFLNEQLAFITFSTELGVVLYEIIYTYIII